MAPKTVFCHKCRHQWTASVAVGRRDECPMCHSDARCCLNCRFYDRGHYHECREEQAEWVENKDRANFCSYFEPGSAASDRSAEMKKVQDKLQGLFKPNDKEPAKAEPAMSFADDLARFLESKKR